MMFYIDFVKVNVDFKVLLEGGMEDEEEEDDVFFKNKEEKKIVGLEEKEFEEGV